MTVKKEKIAELKKEDNRFTHYRQNHDSTYHL